MNERSTERRQFLQEAVFGLKNVVVQSLRTDWETDRIELGLTDGQRTLLLSVDLNDARFAEEADADAA